MALVVQHGDGSTVTRCVSFSGSSLTGEDVLSKSGIEFKTLPFGALSDGVCQVDNEPATFPATCWTSTSPFWTLFVARKGGSWAPSSLGAASQVFHDGDAEGVRYESQGLITVPTIKGSCPSPAPPPVATPAVTPRPTPHPTAAATSAIPVPSVHPGATTTSSTTSPTPAESALASAIPAASPNGQVAGVTGGPGPSSGAAPAGSTNSPPGSDDQGSPTLPIAVLAILGLAGLATIRRPGSRRPR